MFCLQFEFQISTYVLASWFARFNVLFARYQVNNFGLSHLFTTSYFLTRALLVPSKVRLTDASMDSGNNGFYAVLLSPDIRRTNTFQIDNLVSPDRSIILDICKKNKDSRFKRFNTYDEALKYTEDESVAVESLDTSINSTASVAAEVAPPFPSLDTPRLSQFMRLIQQKDLDQIQSNVTINPRYLISYSSDSPTILKQSARYNAVHLAVWYKAPEVLEYVLKTVNSLTFIKRCYPSLSDDSITEKRDHLLDLFLNTPEKILFNTPLHIACKNGDLLCIKVLLNYVPLIVTKQKNKFGVLPKDIVQDEQRKTEIEQLLKACMFVTVVRSDNNCYVKINEPSYGRRSVHLESSDVTSLSKDSSRISTIVGPMTPDCAKDLYETLKSPKKCTLEQRSLRMKDSMKGVEKVARGLCYNLNVSCQEYWSFLDDYVDISSKAGLARLEEHLQKQHYELMFSEAMKKLTLLQISSAGDEVPKTNGLHKPINDLESTSNEELFYDPDEEDDDIFYTPPTTPICENIQVQQFYIKGETRGQEDEDVFAALELAIEQGVFTIDSLKTTHSFLCHWFGRIKSDILK